MMSGRSDLVNISSTQLSRQSVFGVKLSFLAVSGRRRPDSTRLTSLVTETSLSLSVVTSPGPAHCHGPLLRENSNHLQN